MKLIVILLCAILLEGCASSSQQSKRLTGALDSSVEERLALVTKTNDSLLSVIRALKPEAFTEVGLSRVNPGDNASKIAREHRLRIDELMILNPGVDWTKLKVWQIVRVKKAEEKELN